MKIWSETDRIKAAISDPAYAPMGIAAIVTEEVRTFRASDAYHEMIDADSYYRNRSDVQRKARRTNRTNTKLEHPIYKRLVDQKVSYQLSKPWTVECGNERYRAELDAMFDARFRHGIKTMFRNAVKSGISFLQPYIDQNGRLSFVCLPSTEVIPLWKDAVHEELDAFIRIWEQTVYVGNRKTTVHHAEFWFSGGVQYFIAEGTNDFSIDKDYGSEENGYLLPHFTVGNRAYNFEQVPLVWLKYNDEELPLLHDVKEQIDDYNWQTSVTADTLRDVSNFVYALRGYSGTDLKQFVRELQDCLAITLDPDGGEDKLQAELNIDAVTKHLERTRNDLFEFSAGLDTQSEALMGASGRAIRFRYTGLDNDCYAIAEDLKAAFSRMKIFLDAYLGITGKGDFSAEEFDIVFNTDMPVDETEVITNCRNSVGLISNQTILENHPWVKDVTEEQRRIEQEKQQEMGSYSSDSFAFGGVNEI